VVNREKPVFAPHNTWRWKETMSESKLLKHDVAWFDGFISLLEFLLTMELGCNKT
jgi:hypothetical protein